MAPLPDTTLDHLVVAGATLAQTIEHFADLTGVVARPGGRHATMGTHNALVRLGPRTYLELIAIDPDAAPPARPRWFDLDDATLQTALGDRPALIHWVARTTDIDRAVARATHAPGPIHALSPGDYRWRISVPDDGRRPGDGLVPTLIQWDVAQHPTDTLPDQGVSLVELAGSHPSPDAIRRSLDALGVAGAVRVTSAPRPRLAAMLRTPRGLVTI
jgi:hypothetical protein